MSRPSEFTAATAFVICQRLSEGESLRKICSDDNMPDKSTVMRWLHVHKEFRDQYAQAREAQADAFAEDILEIADDSSEDVLVDPESGNTRQNSEFVNRSRLRVDTRKWLMARMAPKKYGDRVMNEHTGANGGPIETLELSETEAARRIAFTLAKQRQAKQLTH